jgi:hypothetical protein
MCSSLLTIKACGLRKRGHIPHPSKSVGRNKNNMGVESH